MQIKSANLFKGFEITIPENVTLAHVVALVVESRRLFQALVKHKDGKTWFSLQDKDTQGRTVIHWAAGQEAKDRNEAELEENNATIISMLIECGLSSNVQANNGRSPMHIASQLGRLEAIATLNRHGGNIGIIDQASLTPLHLASFSGSVGTLSELMKRGAAVDARTADQWTPIHLAAMNGRTDVINALVSANAAVDARADKQ
ncbi:hypothetical protein N7467_006035 [Penicillium canescens]|nr:hypothetical protein N7467_006035 [Penicillium canescens]